MNIIIAGGGTAGWIAAYFICKSQPNQHNITVIESSEIGIIGAGEGSTGSMFELLDGHFFNYKLDIKNFLEKTDGTYKMGILHQNWTGDNTKYFAPIDVSSTGFSYEDVMFKYVLSQYGVNKMHLSSEIGINYEKKEFHKTSAYHFDGHKVGKFFKSICEQDGVKVIDDVIEDVILENENVSTLILKNSKSIKGDFFIDCTGFKRIIMNKLNVKWKSYSDFLPVNCAMPFILEYEKDEKIVPYTTATALSSGWMWNIPLKTRKGCGYVFDENCISKEQAQNEIENHLQKKIKPIKFIKFDSGRSESFWKNNVLSLGLSSAFVEPLEATSIHFTIIQLLFFVNEYLLEDKNKTLSKYNQKSYNEKICKLFDLTLDFISYHYQGKRNDTKFWQNINGKMTENAKIYFERSKEKIPSVLETNGIFGSPTSGLWNWISAGLKIITPEQAHNELKNKNLIESVKKHHKDFCNNLNFKQYITYD